MKKKDINRNFGKFSEMVGKIAAVVPATVYGIGKIGTGIVKGKSFKEIDEDEEANETFDSIIEAGGEFGRKNLGSILTALGTAAAYDKMKGDSGTTKKKKK